MQPTAWQESGGCQKDHSKDNSTEEEAQEYNLGGLALCALSKVIRIRGEDFAELLQQLEARGADTWERKIP